MILESRLWRAVTLALAAAVVAGGCNKNSSTSGATTAPSCAFSVVQPTNTFGPEGGTGSATVTVTAGTGCAWTATSSAAFITFTTASGTGSGTAAFTVAVNTGAERTATLTIAGTSVTITQRAAAATPTLAAPTPRSPSGGQDVELRPTLVVNNAVSTGNIGTVTYRFEVSSDNTFPNDPSKTTTQDGVAQGSGTTSWPIPQDLTQGVVYFWRARATNGTITTAFSAVESFRAGGGLCSYVLSPTSVSVGGGGGSSTITITTTSGCNWVAVSNDGFIVLTSLSSGSGSGSVTFSVASNAGAARSGSLTIAGQTVTVSQSAGTGSSTSVVASFQLFDSAAQAGATTECRFRSATGAASTCTLRSTSFTLGTTSIVSQSWSVDYVYDAAKTITGTAPTLSFTDTCGKPTSTDDGVSQPLNVKLTVTDSAGNSATATSGSGSQPALFVRLFTCGK
jgi:Viral BACON domain